MKTAMSVNQATVAKFQVRAHVVGHLTFSFPRKGKLRKRKDLRVAKSRLAE